MRTELAITRVVGWASTVTAKSSVPLPSGGMSGTGWVHMVPGGLPLAHDQPGALAAVLKVVESGTVSVIITPVAVLPPMLA